MAKSDKKMNSYTVLYGTSDKELISAETQLQAEKAAHIKAQKRRTLVVYVKPLYN